MLEAADAASRFDTIVLFGDRDALVSRAREVHALFAAARRDPSDGALPAKAEVGPKAVESPWARDSRYLRMAHAGGCASPKADVEAFTRLKRAALQEGGGTSAAPLNVDDFLAAKALEYSQMPPAAKAPGALPVTAAVGLFCVGAVGLFGVFAQRRPRMAASIAGLAWLWEAHRVESSVLEMKRHGATCERVAATARAVENGTAEGGSRGGEGQQ
jgi:hypothetical protein